MKRASSSILALTFFSVVVTAQQTPSFPGRGSSRQVFAAWDARESPGCALGIYKDGVIVYERGYGMADLEHDVPITPETPFYIGSVSKQFTAFAAALVIHRESSARTTRSGGTSRSCRVRPAAITVRHLVHHTSGLRDFYTLFSVAGRRRTSSTTISRCSGWRLANRTLNFAPGSDYLTPTPGMPCSPCLLDARPDRRFPTSSTRTSLPARHDVLARA